MAANLLLAHSAQGEDDACHLFLGQSEEKIALILGRIEPFAQDEALRLALDTGIMAGGEEIGLQLPRPPQQQLELEPLITEHAGIGSAAGEVIVAETVDDLPLEILFKIYDVKRDIEAFRDPSGVVDIVVGTTAAAGFAIFFRERGIVPDLHGHADHFMPLLLEQSGRDAGIDPAAHGDDNTFFRCGHRCLSPNPRA